MGFVLQATVFAVKFIYFFTSIPYNVYLEKNVLLRLRMSLTVFVFYDNKLPCYDTVNFTKFLGFPSLKIESLFFGDRKR